jgi:hypothetical protein
VGTVKSAGWVLLVGEEVVRFFKRETWARKAQANLPGSRIAEVVYSSALKEREEWPT